MTYYIMNNIVCIHVAVCVCVYMHATVFYGYAIPYS